MTKTTNNPKPFKHQGLLALVLLFLCLVTPFAAKAEALYHEFTLKNGLHVVVAPDFRAPVVAHMVWYKAGSMDEVPNKSGIAHMLEHMMFKGTPTVPAGEFARRVSHLGGEDNAFTTRDFTAYHERISRQNLEKIMTMEADRMANLAITDEVFQPERAVVLEERNMRVDSRPMGLFYEQLMAKHFPHHPYGHPTIGWRKDIENYTLADAQNWYHINYAPNNALLVLVGDITVDDAKALAEKYYGPIAARPLPPKPAITPEPLRPDGQKFTYADARVRVPIIYRLYRAPALTRGVAGAPAPALKTLLALSMAADILGGGPASRLYQTLVTDQQLADNVSMSYDPVGRDEQSIDLYLQPKPGIDPAKLEAAADKIIGDFLHDGPTQDELDRAIMSARSSDVFARDSLMGTANRLASWVMSGGALDAFQSWLDILPTLTQADVLHAAQTWMVKAGTTTGLMVPEKKG